MKPISTLKELLKEMLKNCYDSELQQLEAFPQLTAKATSPELKQAIETSAEHSQKHIEKLEAIFKRMKISPIGDICEATVGSMNETWKLLAKIELPEVRDAALLTEVQQIHHHDIAVYGAMCSFANAVEYYETASILHEMLDEEKAMDRMLSEMAMGKINARAKMEIQKETEYLDN